MPLLHALLVAAAGRVAGALNTIAGGGRSSRLPLLIAVGLPSIQANAVGTIALLPAGQLGAWMLRHRRPRFDRVGFGPLITISVAGDLTGAMLLRTTPTHLFDQVLRWLVLVATLAFAFGRTLGARLRQRMRVGRTRRAGGPRLSSRGADPPRVRRTGARPLQGKRDHKGNRSGGHSAACHAQMYTIGAVLRHGSYEQKQAYLPEIAKGALRRRRSRSPRSERA
jgi:hypothetical protein